MRIRSITYRRLVSLQNFNNHAVEITAELDPDDSPELEMSELKDRVHLALGLKTQAQEAAEVVLDRADRQWDAVNTYRQSTYRNASGRRSQQKSLVRWQEKRANPGSADSIVQLDDWIERAKEEISTTTRNIAACVKQVDQCLARARTQEEQPDVNAARVLLGRQPPRLWCPADDSATGEGLAQEEDIPF